MAQLVVQFNQTHVFWFDSKPTVRNVKDKLVEAEEVPYDLLSLNVDGAICNNDDNVIDEAVFVRVTLVAGLCGGKGGFGAQLRALAKQKAHKKTVDFGACRDLSGRRLRHVNDEILLQKWKDAKDNNESLEIDETPTGIDLWYLSAPSWAEGVKVDKRKTFMKPRLKTALCIDWKRARENRSAPDGAPAHWGCPRGRRCEFAHGVEELRGEAQIAMKDAELQKERDEQHKKRDDYMNVLHRAVKEEEELEDLVLAGLRAAKKAKLAAEKGQNSTATGVEEQEEQTAEVDASGDTSDGEVVEEQGLDFFTAVSGTVVVSRASTQKTSTSSSSSSSGSNAVCPVISGTSAFATVVVDKCALVADSSAAWYYEVELQSDGLMQIGWADSSFAPSTSPTSTAELQEDTTADTEGVSADGVGDCTHSWAFDGYRQLKWHAGESAQYGPQTGTIWKVGDVVGCLLELSPTSSNATVATKKRKLSSTTCTAKAIISYTVNGTAYGTAFEVSIFPTISGSPEHFFPAVSLENGESVELNLGSKSFQYQPAESSAGKVTPVWDSVLSMDNGSSSSDKAAVQESEGVDVSATTPAAVVTAAPVTGLTTVSVEPVVYPEISLEDAVYADATAGPAALQALGLVHLKQELERRGMKTGGTLQERALRLYSVRGVQIDKIDPKLLTKKK